LDVEGRAVSEKQNDFEVKSTFDVLGRRIRRETVGHVVTFEYDALGRTATVCIDGERRIAAERDAEGQVLKEILGPELERHYRYDAEGRMTAQGVRSEVEWLFHTQYGYDLAGNLTERRDSQYGIEHYRYDPLGQVVEHVDPQGRLKRFLQDPVGDRLPTRVMDSSMPQQTGHGSSPGEWSRQGWYQGVFYRFDAAGNLVERRDDGHAERPDDEPKASVLGWDAMQRLVHSRTNGIETSYGYDPLGRRVFKRTGAKCTWFGWDGDTLAAEGPGETPRQAPMPPAHGRLVGLPARQAAMYRPPAWHAQREIVHHPDSFVPLALMDKDAGTFLYHIDPNGSATKLMGADGHVVWAARYEAWGQARLLVNEVSNPLRLQGQYHDDETGLHYNWHRYFDAVAGVFTSADPIGLSGGLNLHSYAVNSIAWIDPWGWAAKGDYGKMPGIPSYQKHHIIPQNMANHPVIARSGYDVHNSRNIIRLPTSGLVDGAVGGASPGRTIHRGMHQEAYNTLVRDRLDRIHRLRASPEITRLHIQAMADDLADDFRNGRIKLNNAC